MTINEMIERYDMRLTSKNGEDAIAIPRGQRLPKKQISKIKEVKTEIIAELKRREAEKKAAYEARKAKINAIVGLKELKDAIATEITYANEFNRMMEDEYNDGLFPPNKPEISVKELAEKYPRAAAYIKAEDWSYASNYAKAGAGSRAKERIINGEDHNKVLEDMEKEWTDYCTERAWD